MTLTLLLPELVIDPAFRDLLPRPTDEERAELRALISEHGCQAVKVWVHEGIHYLIDGFTRRDICELDLHLPFLREEVRLKNRAEVMRWIVRNQLGRRNLSTQQRAMFAAKLANANVGGDRQSDHSLSRGNGSVTVAQAAAEAGVSHASVERAKKVVAKGTPELQQKVEAGGLALATAARIAGLPKAEQPKALKAAKAPKPRQGIAVKVWNDEDFIAVLGKVGKQIDDAFTKISEAVDRCRELTKGQKVDAERVKQAASYAKTKSHELLGPVEKAFRKWRPKK